MQWLKNVKMKPKMIGLFLSVGLIPVLLVGLFAANQAGEELSRSSYDKLDSVRAIKQAQITKFFGERQGDLGVLLETVSALRAEAFRKLEAVRETRRASVESYFTFIEGQIRTFSEDRMVVNAMGDLAAAFPNVATENGLDDGAVASMRSAIRRYHEEVFGPEYVKRNGGQAPDTGALADSLSASAAALQHYYINTNEHPLGSKHLLDRASDTSAYSAAHDAVHPLLRAYLEEFGYYDIFLADAETGRIVYSVFKEIDFGTSLVDGPFAETNLGEAFRLARDSADPRAAVLVDYKRYQPSFDAPASFVASPIQRDGRTIGVAIFQMPIDRLNVIMTEAAGLGETGETYLAGPDHLMRSDSRQNPETHSVLASFKDPAAGNTQSEGIDRALRGETGTAVLPDYKGRPVLAAYAPVKVGDATWALMAEIDVAEAFVPKDMEGTEYYAKYVEKYGYHDLFLLNPDGYCFYSAGRESDYQTNLLTGPYKDTTLGKLVDEVMQSKAYGIADFAPYEPSGGAPAAFIAQPLLHDGAVELVVGLQLSLEAINTIMQQSEGMGESGETYLVGQDLHMRSDSRLDPEGHSVVASFANDTQIKTASARAALDGQSGREIVIDYNGTPVLSSYGPVDLGAFRWALLAEINEDEVNKPVDDLLLTLWIGIAVIAVIVTLLAIGIAVSIVKPLLLDVALAEVVAEGDLTQRVALEQNDELGMLAKALNSMTDNLRGIIGSVSECSTSLTDSSVSMTCTSQDMADKSEQMAQLAANVAAAAEQGSANLRNVAAAIEEISANSDNVSASSEQVSANLITVGAAVEQMSANMNSIASAVEQMTMSVNTVATASEEMSSSLSEVAANTQNAAKTADAATVKADATVKTVDTLGQSARAIGRVVDLITGIAAQTNLLALNATIEAASAGEAGKGFAVVASEVKELARQTSSATGEIAAQVSTMQADTAAVTSAITEIVQVIGDMRALFDSIAAALSEQTNTINEIARSTSDAASGADEVSRNVQEAAKGAGEVSRNVQEASQGVNEIVKHIAELAQGTTEIARNAGEASTGMNDIARSVGQVSEFAHGTKNGAVNVNAESEGMAQLATELHAIVSRFKVN